MESSVFKGISEVMVRNTISYQNFIDFSSDLSNIISNSAISNHIYSNIISTSSFINQNKKPSITDVLSGNTFTLFDETNDFDNEKEIIEQINNNEQLKEEAINFFDELNQIINDDTNIYCTEVEKVENIYSNFVNWISNAFNKTKVDAQKISKKLIIVLPLIISFSHYHSVQNKIAHEKTQNGLKDMEDILIYLYTKIENNSERLFNIN